MNGTRSLDEGKLDFIENGINFIGRVNENNGIKGKIANQAFLPNEPNTITATVIGNYKYVKFQKEPYYCSQNINKLKPKFLINEKIAIYIMTNIYKFVSLYDG
ncbi:restriction endonuclease subunit S [Campylobacter concisus]|uniref:restriction endonuclease subunit S n=1 Tax=Campylobacter concisus TaxID=199 RepID=UPI0021560193|nr:restriction endonuclease subunit S [Campylobacter concisus]